MVYDYDVIIVGGGLGGAALGKALAERRVRVLVLERETAFRDRVRGEYMHPWGVAEARTLGLYEPLKQTCGHEARFRASRIAGVPPAPRRDLVATSPHGVGSLHFYHPEMQELVLAAALEAGAIVERGVTVVEVSPGPVPSVRVRAALGECTYRARLVVGADGRNSACRKWAGFTVDRDPDRMMLAGVLFEGLGAPDDATSLFTNPELGLFAITIPLRGRRYRCYAGFYQQGDRRPLGGRKAVEEFVADCVAAGAPAEWFTGAQVGGPLASFNCADTWVVHPYQRGVVLIGDAAASSDPTFGCGLSLVLRDVRVLSDLLSDGDWDEAAHAYAAEHDRYFGSIHRQLDWLTKLLYEPGPGSAVRRARAFARIAEDPGRVPDIAGLGPEWPCDESAYRNLFGED